MAPEFPYLTTAGKYVGYIQALEGYYDFIAPQYYNQGGDGIWVQEVNSGNGAWIAQNNDALKEDFLFYLTESLVSGTRGFTKIPADKFVIGLPANVDAAATGYVVNPTAVTNTFKRLHDKGLSIKGLMTWSVNWDNGINKDHVPYNWEFSRRYGPMINGTAIAPAYMTSTCCKPSAASLCGGSIWSTGCTSGAVGASIAICVTIFPQSRASLPASARLAPTCPGLPSATGVQLPTAQSGRRDHAALRR